jgi:hypothetical protein
VGIIHKLILNARKYLEKVTRWEKEPGRTGAASTDEILDMGEMSNDCHYLVCGLLPPCRTPNPA